MAERPSCSTSDVAAWFAGRLPEDWFLDVPRVLADREEVIVVGRLPEPDGLSTDPDQRRLQCEAYIEGFRDRTRPERMRIAEQAQARWRRHVSWGAACGEVELRFTTISVPVMTRLRFDDRAVLDTLVDAGVARSRSEALAWCVRLVGDHESDWISRLREAMAAVEAVRSEGPGR